MPALGAINKSAVILVTTILFFIFNILNIDDLESIPWNIILLFGGAMSIGFCLWQTGAASWLAIQWLGILQNASWPIFVLGIALFVMIMTNLIMNVAAIAISMPVALVIAPYIGVAPEVVLFASLVTAGMPFLLLVGAAPNAIAYESKQFSTWTIFPGRCAREHTVDAGFGVFRRRRLANYGYADPGEVDSENNNCIIHLSFMFE